MGEQDKPVTVADVMRRMQAEPRYESYAMHSFPSGFEGAVLEAEKLGLVDVERHWRDWTLMVSLTEAGKAWTDDKPPLPQRVPGKSLTDAYAEQQMTEAADRDLRAQRLGELHSWLSERYVDAVEAVHLDRQRVYAEVLYFIETGQRPLEYPTVMAEYEKHLLESASDAVSRRDGSSARF